MTSDTPDNTTKFHSPDPSVPIRPDEETSEGTTDVLSEPDLSFLGPPIEPGDLGQLSTYRIRRVLGIGGMGIVFEAIDSQLRRMVALKVMRPEIASSLAARTRFLKEARAAAALSSDHIVTVFQVGQDNDVPFMAMQLLKGEALDMRLRREPRMAVADALTVAMQAAAGLSAAHDAGLIHRDIKPANLWLEIKDEGAKKSAESGRLVVAGSGPDTSFRVKILDLGLVRGGGGPRLTTAGVVVGTPHFMAPEQAGGSEIDHRADLFSLGCVIYTMLSGELAFPGNSTMAVLMALANHTPPMLHEKNEAVPRELSHLVARMMAKNREGRPPSALQIIEHLTEILDAEMENKAQLPPPRKPGSGKVGWAEAVRQQPVPELKSRLGLPAAPQQSTVLTGATPNPTSSQITTEFPQLASRPTQSTPPAVVPGSGSEHPTVAPHPGKPNQGVSVGIGLVAIAIALVAFALILGVGERYGNAPPPVATGPIKIGILHSKTGSMALSESPVIDATLLAMDEVNQGGGVLGRQLQPIVIDGKSDPETFAIAADKLLGEEKVAVVFGCWTSASRKAVKPSFERYGELLFYPVHYEGLEQSPRIVYLGAAPNQQLLPAIDFLTKKLGKKRVYIVGSDYVYPRPAAEIIADHIKKSKLPGVELVGSGYVPLGSKDVKPLVDDIVRLKPDAIVNLLNGTTNFSFFKDLKLVDITAEKIAIISTSITENELRGLDPETMAGSYLVGNFFQSLDREEARGFLQKIQARFGPDRVVSDAMAAAYSGVHLWAKAANAAGVLDADAVMSRLQGETFAAPGATVKIDPVNRHTWQPWRIGKVRADGQVDVIASSNENVAPAPFPNSRTRADWERYLEGLYIDWGSRWQAPASP